MKLKDLLKTLKNNDSISKSRIIRDDIIKLCDNHIKQKYQIYEKYSIASIGHDLDGYVPGEGSWSFAYGDGINNEVRLEYTIYYGACGCEGFTEYFNADEVDNFDWKAFEDEVKAKRIKDLTREYKSLIDNAEKISKQIEELQKNEA